MFRLVEEEAVPAEDPCVHPAFQQADQDPPSIDQARPDQALNIDQTMLAMDHSIRVIDRTLQGLHQDAHVQLIDASGHLIDAERQIIDADGELIDASGHVISAEGHVLDAEGHIVMLSANHLLDQGLYPSLHQFQDPVYSQLQYTESQYNPEQQYIIDPQLIGTPDQFISTLDPEYSSNVQYNNTVHDHQYRIDPRYMGVLEHQFSDVEYPVQSSCDLEQEYIHQDIRQYNQEKIEFKKISANISVKLLYD